MNVLKQYDELKKKCFCEHFNFTAIYTVFNNLSNLLMLFYNIPETHTHTRIHTLQNTN